MTRDTAGDDDGVTPLTDHPDAERAVRNLLDRGELSEASESGRSLVGYAIKTRGAHIVGEQLDPDGINSVLKRFPTGEWPSDPPTSGAEKATVRRAYYHLRYAGSTSTEGIFQAVYDGNITDVYDDGPHEWFREACDPFLRYLPHVVPPETGGGVWCFDATAGAGSRPPVPDDPVDPDPEAVEAALDDYDFPEVRAGPHVQARNRLGVERAFDVLQEVQVATGDALKECYDTTAADVEGVYKHAGRWWADVGRPALASLPGVDAPRVIGQSWRYPGVGDPVRQEDVPTEDEPPEDDPPTPAREGA